MTWQRPKGLEVHEHSFVSGPRTQGYNEPDGSWSTGKFKHSHEGGSQPHQHPDTGPASYGRDKFTVKPAGEQFPIVALEDWQKSFTVIVCDPPKGFVGEGGGMATAERMVRTFRMRATVVDGRR